MGKPSKQFHIINADMTGDGEVDISDVVLNINAIKETE